MPGTPPHRIDPRAGLFGCSSKVASSVTKPLLV